jgi:hypothetical protein
MRMTFQKKQAPVAAPDEEEEAAGAGPATLEALPHRFVLLEGCERSFVLVQEQEQILRDGRLHITPGIRISGRPIPGVKTLRIVDLSTAPYCTRAQNKYTPDQVAALIMADKRYCGDNPVISSYEDWQADLAFERELKEDSKTRADAYAAEQRAKRGKRGAAA